MICPRCLTDYRDGFEVCADCGEDLVSELPPEIKPQAPPAEYAPLLEVTDRLQYGALQAHLAAAGIEYFPGAELAARLRLPFLVHVRADRFMEAQSLVEDLELLPAPMAAAGNAAEASETPTQPVLEEEEENAAMEIVAEAAVVREGRYLIIEEDGRTTLPGGVIMTADRDAGSLEGALLAILADEYGLEVDERLAYVASWFTDTGVQVLFLARWRAGGAYAASFDWYLAGELAQAGDLAPARREALEKADRVRANLYW